MLMRVDFPSPVCPGNICYMGATNMKYESHTNDDNVELKTTFQKLVLDLAGNRVKPNIGRGTDFFDCGGHGSLT